MGIFYYIVNSRDFLLSSMCLQMMRLWLRHFMRIWTYTQKRRQRCLMLRRNLRLMKYGRARRQLILVLYIK